MTKTEWVTDFKLDGATKEQLVDAVNAYCGHLAEESKFTCMADGPLPEFRWLIAFAVEGDNEGYYVHFGSLKSGAFSLFGVAKTYSPESAYKLATEASRFLAASRWN